MKTRWSWASCLLSSTLVGVFLAGIPVLQRSEAQLPTGTILGTVEDQTGAVVPDVTVTVTHTETGVSRITRTANNGSYRFVALPVGSYTVRGEKTGFQTVVQSGLRLTVGEEAVLHFQLQVGAVTESVSVTAEAPIVNTTSGTLSSLVSQERISDLPLNGRNFDVLTFSQAGIAAARNISREGTLDGTQFSAGGAPIRSNTFLLDGTVMNNITNSGAASANENTLGVESIREYRVLMNSYTAEYGMSMGAQVSIVTKSGTNELHGSLFEYLRNSALDARNWTDIPDKSSLRRNSFGGSLGGPIVRDRLFFFASYEGLRQRRGATLAGVVPTADARRDGVLVPTIKDVVKPYLDLFPLPNGPDLGQGLGRFFAPVKRTQSEEYASARIDYTLSDSDTLFGRWTINDPRAVDPAFSQTILPPMRVEVGGRNQWITVSENHIFSPTLLNTVRASFARTANSSPQFGANPPGLNFVEGQPMGGLGIIGMSEIAPNRPTLDVKLTRYSFGDDVFYTRGRHSLKFGTQIHKTRNFVLVTTNRNGQWSFASLPAFLEARAEAFTLITPGSRNDRTYDFSILGFYLQDDFQMRPNFTLNLGLRYEFHTEYEEIRGLGYAVRDIRSDAEATPGAPFANPSLRNFSPRFGFAWDVRGDGKTALRGGFGLLYDLATIGSSFIVGATATPPISTTTRITRPEFRPLPAIPTGRGSRTLRTIDYHLQQPHLLSYNLTLERELPFGMGLTLAYAGSRGINLIQSKDGNPTVPSGTVEGNCVRRHPPPPFVADGPKCWHGDEPRPNPNWADVEFKTAGSSSWYNSMQFQLTKRVSRGLQFTSSYTYSKLLDETQGQFQGPEGLGAVGDDPSNRRHDRGRAEFDIRHQWRLNALYRFPSPLTGHWGKIGNGWWTGAILTWNSGIPFAPRLATQRSRSAVLGPNGGDRRPHLVAGFNREDITRGTSRGCDGVPAGTKLGTPERFYDPCAFAIQPIGFLGNASRGTISGPNFSTLDLSLAKDTPLPFLGERASLQFRAEFFNILNHPSFGLPERVVFTGRADREPARATAGQITSTFSQSREIQLALKIVF